MATATYSAVLDHPAETVWSLIRDFNNDPAYIDGVTESAITGWPEFGLDTKEDGQPYKRDSLYMEAQR